MITCIRCKEYKPLKGRGMCFRCYKKWYRKTRERKKLELGTMPLTAEQLEQLRLMAEGKWAREKMIKDLDEEILSRRKKIASEGSDALEGPEYEDLLELTIPEN